MRRRTAAAAAGIVVALTACSREPAPAPAPQLHSGVVEVATWHVFYDDAGHAYTCLTVDDAPPPPIAECNRI